MITSLAADAGVLSWHPSPLDSIGYGREDRDAMSNDTVPLIA